MVIGKPWAWVVVVGKVIGMSSSHRLQNETMGVYDKCKFTHGQFFNKLKIQRQKKKDTNYFIGYLNSQTDFTQKVYKI